MIINFDDSFINNLKKGRVLDLFLSEQCEKSLILIRLCHSSFQNTPMTYRNMIFKSTLKWNFW